MYGERLGEVGGGGCNGVCVCVCVRERERERERALELENFSLQDRQTEGACVDAGESEGQREIM